MSILDRIFGRPDKKAEHTPGVWDKDGLMLVNAYATVRALPAIDFPHDFHNGRDLSDPEMAQHLRGFSGFVMRTFDGKMTAGRYHLLMHVERVRNQASFSIGPDAVEALAALAAWARAANAVLFLPDGSIRTPELDFVLGADGGVNDSAHLPYPADAVERRARALEQLAGIEPAPPASVPPSLGVDEVVLQDAPDVWRRALGLYCVAAQGAAFSSGRESLLTTLRSTCPAGLEALTPNERQGFDAPEMESAVAAQMSWRFEALHVLLWALSIVPGGLGPANLTVETEPLVSRLMEAAQNDPAGVKLKLRPATEILDALDLVWRQHWITRQAALKSIEVAALNPLVVQERHLALNWLTHFQNAGERGWDDIDTPT